MGTHWIRPARGLGGLALGLLLTISAASGCATGASSTSSAGGPPGGDETAASTSAPAPAATGGASSTGGPGEALTSPAPGSGPGEDPGDMTDPKLPGIEKTLRGTVAPGVEANCMLLHADDGQGYLLIGGDRKLITEGARVEVTGQVMTGLATTCMQGTPFTVSTVRRI
jgi:hypothetical protein